MFENLEQLIKTIRERKNSSPDKSYTNKLLNDKNLSVSKVKEEIGELIESVEKNSNKIHEAADVIYHLMVYLEANNIKIEDVMNELKKKTKMSYDKNNIFAKILRGEIPCKKVYENDHVLAFHDINPQKKVHVLVIPKGEYVDLDDFNNKASDKEIVEFNKAVSHVANLLGAKDKGYRALTNIGSDGGQEVPHLHFHIFAGEKIGKMVKLMISRVKRYFLEIKDFSKTIELNLPENYQIILDDKKNFHLNKFFYKQIGVDHYWRDRLLWSDKEWIKYVKIKILRHIF